MIEFPSAELLAARQRHLEECMAAPFWNAPWKKPVFEPKPKKPQAAPPAIVTVEAALSVAETYRARWQAALAEKQAILDEGSAGRIDGYWKAEHSARARFATALLILEALGE